MKKTRHTPNQIITKLRAVEAARAEGQTIAEAVRGMSYIQKLCTGRTEKGGVS